MYENVCTWEEGFGMDVGNFAFLAHLKRLKLFKGFFTCIAKMNRAAKGWPESVLQFGIGAIASRAYGVLEYFQFSKYFPGGWGR